MLKLTDTELAVMELICDGRDVKSIACVMDISDSVIYQNIADACARNNCRTRAELAYLMGMEARPNLINNPGFTSGEVPAGWVQPRINIRSPLTEVHFTDEEG